MDGTSVARISVPLGVKSIALYASGRMGNVISDMAELPETNRK